MLSSTPVKPRVLLSWSSGKDAAWVLHMLRQAWDVEVVGLLTTLSADGDRVAMHAVRRTLLEAQVRAAGLPLLAVPLPWPCSNAEYEEATARALGEARERWGITHVAFGDLFLEDVRAYRERQMTQVGLTPLFPLWGLPTRALARDMIAGGLEARLTCIDPRRLPESRDMIAGGLEARLTCIDPRRLPESLAGRAFDAALLEALPPDVDPCGEAGEFHTFAFAGPMFSHPVPTTLGEVVARDGFVFADLLPPSQGDQIDAH